MKRKKYWVYLNGEYIAEYRTLRGCLDFIERRKLEYNYDNDLGIIDNEGNEYHPYTGKMYMNNTLRESKRINEWNFWDGDNRRSSSAPRQTRLIDVADRMRREEMISRRERYKNDPEYHEHIKRLEDELRRTDDPQHSEYLERRISKLRSLSESKAINNLNEDSLDDFDIDGCIERKRNAVPDNIKLKVKNLLNKNYQKLYKYCDEFFEMNNLNIQISKKDYNTNNDTYVVYYPDLLWGFAYNENDPIEFIISIGMYGNIAGNRNYNENKQLLIELGDFLKSHINGLNYRYNDIRKTEMSEIYSASYVLPVSIKLKDLGEGVKLSRIRRRV